MVQASRHRPQLTSARSRYSWRVLRVAVCWLVSSLACTRAKVSSATIRGTATAMWSSGGRGAWLSPGPTGNSADLRRRAGTTRVRLVCARPA
jgi:hypothetical protein